MSVESPIKYVLGEMLIENRTKFRSIAMKIVGTADAADDVVQDAYIKLCGLYAPQVDKPYNYCCQVVRNLALDYRRRQVVENSYRVYSDDGELPAIAGGVDPSKNLQDRRLLEAIEKVLSTLPARTRHVFELYRLAGMTQREIARQQGCSATLINFILKDAARALMSCESLLEGE